MTFERLQFVLETLFIRNKECDVGNETVEMGDDVLDGLESIPFIFSVRIARRHSQLRNAGGIVENGA